MKLSESFKEDLFPYGDDADHICVVCNEQAQTFLASKEFNSIEFTESPGDAMAEYPYVFCALHDKCIEGFIEKFKPNIIKSCMTNNVTFEGI